MRSERGISIAAIVVMLCCMGSVASTCPIIQSNTRMTNVVAQSHACELNAQVSKRLDAPEQTTLCTVTADLPKQIEVEPWHNLPPPAQRL